MTDGYGNKLSFGLSCDGRLSDLCGPSITRCHVCRQDRFASPNLFDWLCAAVSHHNMGPGGEAVTRFPSSRAGTATGTAPAGRRASVREEVVGYLAGFACDC